MTKSPCARFCREVGRIAPVAANRRSRVLIGQHISALLAAILLSIVPATAWADTIQGGDPPVFIGTGLGTTCAQGSNPPTSDCFVYKNQSNTPNEVNNLTASFDILEQGNGQPALANPLLVIIGIPNDTSGGKAAPTSLTVTPGTGQLGGPHAYQGDWSQTALPPVGTAGFAGSWHGQPDSVYDFIGLEDSADSSERWSNWTGADAQVNHIVATSFGIYVYSLTTAVSGGGEVGVQFSSSVPQGTFVVAYGCQGRRGSTPIDTACTPNGNVYGTPFTQAGLYTQNSVLQLQGGVPEPSVLILLGTGLLGLGWLSRARRSSSGAAR
jgi:PEP-CTERM motif-containing protein